MQQERAAQVSECRQCQHELLLSSMHGIVDPPMQDGTLCTADGDISKSRIELKYNSSDH